MCVVLVRCVYRWRMCREIMQFRRRRNRRNEFEWNLVNIGQQHSCLWKSRLESGRSEWRWNICVRDKQWRVRIGVWRMQETKVNESLNPQKEDVLMQRLLTAKMYLSLSFWLAFRLFVTLLALLKLLLLQMTGKREHGIIDLEHYKLCDCLTFTES